MMDNQHSRKKLTFSNGDRFEVSGGFNIQVNGEEPIKVEQLKEKPNKGIIKLVGRTRR